MAPVHQRAQGPLPGQGGTAAERQQRETVLQAGEHLVEGEGAHPGRGEFDRQWQPVQALDQLRHRLGVVLGDLEPGQDGRGAPAEQLHRRAGEQLPDRGPTARDRRRQRRHHEHLLPGDAQHVAAGRQHADTGRGPEQGVGQARAGVDEVLAVVQHKQQPPAADMAGDHVEGGAAGLVHQAQRGGHGMGQQLRVAQPGQLHDAHPVAERAVTVAAVRSATRVLPTPPAPVNVTSRDAESSRRTSATSVRRPTRAVRSAGIPAIPPSGTPVPMGTT